MHICFVCREYPPSKRGGGIATYIRGVAQGLCALKQKVTVVCASDDTRHDSQYKDGDVAVIRLSGGDFVIKGVEENTLLQKFRMFYRFKSYRKKLRNAVLALKDVDIIEVAEYGAEGLYFENIGIPVVTRLHTPMLMDHYSFSKMSFNRYTWKFWWQGLQEFKCIKQSKYITSCSTSLKEWTMKELGIDAERIKVIYNPIRIEQPPPSASQQKPTSPNGRHEILYVGTICDWKGVGDLCEAVSLLTNEGVNIRLTMIGKQGVYAELLKEKYQGQTWFNMQGFTPHEEVMQMYAQADVVCFPSWWENFPMVCLEAMSQGAIVLGSNSGGMSEIINDGEDGFLVTPKDAKRIVNRIKEILFIPTSEREKISSAALLKIKIDFTMDIILRQMITYYQRCINDYKINESQ
ncbi:MULTISPECIES: glycosyltransferase family 4 protein [Bacteroidales]|uniref:Glycosyltransferase family 4 protein n=1 Tax=Xylanibacter caecicola TaxID=2736294 RepID=A0ABX2B395_9BACT|nr:MULTISPECIES: glycosyltransferase family 4 protein [Bacteroidales]NPE25731.1 glycosyltransferase family 4 protein [Xylanibacter caecicola]